MGANHTVYNIYHEHLYNISWPTMNRGEETQAAAKAYSHVTSLEENINLQIKLLNKYVNELVPLIMESSPSGEGAADFFRNLTLSRVQTYRRSVWDTIYGIQLMQPRFKTKDGGKPKALILNWLADAIRVLGISLDGALTDDEVNECNLVMSHGLAGLLMQALDLEIDEKALAEFYSSLVDMLLAPPKCEA